RAERPQAHERKAVEHRPHGVLADAEVQVAAHTAWLEIAGTVKLERRLGRGAEVGSPADQPGVMRCDRVEHLATRFPGREALGIWRKGRQTSVPAGRQVATGQRRKLLGQLWMALAKDVEPPPPFGMPGAAAPPDAVTEMLAHAVRDEEFRVLGPAVIALGKLHL